MSTKQRWAAGLTAIATGLAGLAMGSVTAHAATPSDTLAEDLTYMREEERFARDVYTALAEHYDQARPFTKIKDSEQRHFDAVGVMLTRYELADPSAGLEVGDYAYDELDQLYDQYVAQGTQSLTEAYAVGVAIETQDIADLEKAIARTTETDALRVFERLLAGSTHHLKAFSREPGTGTGIGSGNGTGQGKENGTGQGKGGGSNRGGNRQGVCSYS